MHDTDDTDPKTAVGGARPAEPDNARAGMSGGSRLHVWLAVAATVLAVLTVLVVALFTGLLGADADVPNVVGTTEAFARDTLKDAGFEVGTVTQTFSEEKAGTVLGQSPLARTRADRGSRIDLVVSKGAETLVAPTLIGLSKEAALALLAEEGLGADLLPDEYSTEFEPGLVMRQSPAPGERIARGATVSFVIASGRRLPGARGTTRDGSGSTSATGGAGPRGESGSGTVKWPSEPGDTTTIVTVARVIGMARANAESLLFNAGFDVRVKLSANSSVRAGDVSAQEPAPGTRLPAGSLVTLTVSSGPGRASVPDVVGLSASEAKARIVAAGLRAVPVYELRTGSNMVVDQYPRAGTTIDPDGAVTITVDGRPK